MEANQICSPITGLSPALSDKIGYISIRGSANARDRVPNPLWDVLADEWDLETNQNGYINLSVAENTLLHPEIENHIRSKVTTTPQTLRYGKDGFLGSKQLRTTVAAFLTRHMKSVHPVTAEQVVITSGVTNAIETCAWTLMDDGDAVVVGRPYYMGFSIALTARAGVKLLPVSFGTLDPFSLEAVKQYERVIIKAKEDGIRVRGLILCSPHNPLGRCYPTATLVAIMQLCQRFNLHLISDEIYALSVWENKDAPNTVDYTSMLAIDKTGLIDPSKVHVLWGLSKDFGLNGLRIGCIISQNNEPFLKALKNISLFMGPSSMADDAAAGILSDAKFAHQCVEINRQRLAASYAIAVKYLRAHGIQCHSDNNAGLFIWAKLDSRHNARSSALSELVQGENLQRVPGTTKENGTVWKKPSDMMHRLLMNGVLLNSGDEYDAEEDGWFRIIFSHTDEYLMKGLERIVRTVLERCGE